MARRELEVVGGREEALERFRSVYDETMRRIGAGEHYLFPAEYYRELAAGLGNRLGVALHAAGTRSSEARCSWPTGATRTTT